MAKRKSEALPGNRTFNEMRELVQSAVEAQAGGPGEHRWVWVRDLTDEWVVYELEGEGWAKQGCFKATYTVDDAGAVTLGEPAEVMVKMEYEPKPSPSMGASESDKVTADRDRLIGRVLEAKGSDDVGGRIFRVRIVSGGMSKNRRHYPESVLHAASAMYEGAKAYDHHRTEAELATSTIAGLIGYYRNVEAVPGGIDADLHLLPSATHTAEALDASLEAQESGLEPLVGISHDVGCDFKRANVDGVRCMEAVKITSVYSADVVAQPAAGGHATRAVAGGIGDIDHDPEEGHMTLEELLELLDGATPEQTAKLAAGLGLDADAIAKLTAPPPSTEEPPAGDEEKELVAVGKESLMGRLMIREAVEAANLDGRLAESVRRQLPEQFTEADVRRVVETAQSLTAELEKAGLTPKVPTVEVRVEELDKKKEKLYQSLSRNWREGYVSIKEAYADITGRAVINPFDPDYAREIVRESWAISKMDSQGVRAKESVDTSSWGEILGDSITRRLLDLYRGSPYQDWRKIVRVVPVSDFRTQRRVRQGGYGVLPTVAEGGTYQSLTSPTDEEATYAVDKHGGTEDLTFETVTNDDLGAVARIPEALARAAAMTLYRFVFIDLLSGNPTLYDAVALFHASHANTTAVALGESGLNTIRQLMRDQAAYGVSTDVLGLTPKYLIVPNELEATAFKLCNSANAVTSTEDATTPNLHRGLEPIVCDHLTDANDWFAVADPSQAEGIEIGFLGGREEPELLVQDDPRSGAVFSADKVTWKIRHIYDGAVVDYRPFQRGTQ